MFKFIGSIFREMRLTTWPGWKQSYHDFAMVVEYTIFFTAFVILFDWGINNGVQWALKTLLPVVAKIK